MDFVDKIMWTIVGLMGVFIVMLIFAVCFVSGIGYSQGSHTGIVTATQSQGIIWQTKRAYVKTSIDSTQEDIYCVEDEAVYAELEEKVRTGEVVTIEYSHPLIKWKWECGGESDIINKP